jgi:CheY-like chemotaxis protein/anti-sigma regulatory factor (Ser/Thr protein kinase)
LGLVNDILDMTKAESGKIELHPQPYTQEALMSYLDAVIVPLCKEKNIKFTVEADPINVIPLADILRVNQIYFNLLSNAVKYTPEGGQIVCRLRSHITQNHKLIGEAEIIDNGIGMSEKFQKVLFEPFSQENRSDISERRGSGLGLAIVKQLSDIMGGKIIVESKMGEGTRFMLSNEFDYITRQEAQKIEVTSETLADNFHTLDGKHILLCEDHPLNQEIAKTLLEDKGIITEIAENGQQGVDMFMESLPGYYNAVLMDIRMPVLNGYKAAIKIRDSERSDSKTVPIIAMTADAFDDDVKKCMDAGMNAHISKPIDPLNLYKTLLKQINENNVKCTNKRNQSDTVVL